MITILTYGNESVHNLITYFVKDKAQVIQVQEYDKKQKCDLFIVSGVQSEEILLASDLIVDELMFKLYPEIEVNLIIGKLRTKVNVGQYTNEQIRNIWRELP